jgi:hypothetical protein
MISGRATAFILLACCAISAFAAEEKRGPKITSKVFFDVTIDGKEAGALTCM